MPNQKFGSFITSLPSANVPLVGPELLYVNQSTISTLITFGNLTGSIFPVWTNYSPAIGATTGTITTTGTIGGRYVQAGKLVHVEITIPIVTNGTGAGAVLITLPVAAKQGVTNDVPGICGRASNNKSLNTAYNSASQLAIYSYDGTYPGANSITLALNGSYEAA